MIDILSDFIGDLNLIVYALLVLIYVFSNSQLFYEKILDKFDGALLSGIPTNKGTIIQGLIVAFVSMLIFSMYQHDYI